MALHFNRKVVDLLLQQGADVSIPTKSGLVPLILCLGTPRSISGRDVTERCALRLLDAGACATTGVDAKGSSALSVAAALGYGLCVQRLVECGADINGRNAENLTPLLVALQHGRPTVAMQLIKAGADVHVHDDKRSKPLHWAAGAGLDDLVQELLARGANVNALDAHCVSSLMAATSRGHTEVVRMLLRADAQPWRHNLKGLTAQEVARRKNLHDCLHFLERHPSVQQRRRPLLRWRAAMAAQRAELVPSSTASQIGEGSRRRVHCGPVLEADEWPYLEGGQLAPASQKLTSGGTSLTSPSGTHGDRLVTRPTTETQCTAEDAGVPSRDAGIGDAEMDDDEAA